MEYKLVAIFTLPRDLYIIRAKLESDGIECLTRDEKTVEVHNFMSNAIGGIKLYVPAADEDIARQVIIEAGHEPFEEPEQSWAEQKLNKLGSMSLKEIKLPKAKKSKQNSVPISLILIILFVITAILAIFFK